jgi:hypothetical protein
MWFDNFVCNAHAVPIIIPVIIISIITDVVNGSTTENSIGLRNIRITKIATIPSTSDTMGRTLFLADVVSADDNVLFICPPLHNPHEYV